MKTRQLTGIACAAVVLLNPRARVMVQADTRQPVEDIRKEYTFVCAVAEMQLGIREFAGQGARATAARAIDCGCSGVAAAQCPLGGELMAGNSLRRESDDLAIRINELGTKSTQLLQFLSFAILGAATLRTAEFPADQTLVRVATWWWILAVFPILLAVLPVKDFRWNGRTWYRVLVWVKFLLLWVAVIFSGVGAIQFLRAMS